MTRTQALTNAKQQADNWYKSYKLTHRTQQTIDRIKDLTDRYGTLVRHK